MSLDKNFMGLDSFVWWFGIVENRQDPLGLGRVQVRIFGWHNESLTEIPSNNLPWAHVVHSVNDRAFATPREADTVFGFFTDGRNGQTPVVLGIVPGYFTSPPNTGLGFNDLRSHETLRYAPKHPLSRKYNTDGSGIIVAEANTADANTLESLRHPNVDELDKDSITGVARYENLANTVISARKTNLDKDVVTAKGIQWSEPYPAYNPLYPYNQANETESGHVFELDDTPGFERVHIAHRTGSYVEWFPTGTKVEKITKSNYQIVMADDHLHVMGRVMITVDGDTMIRVKGDVSLEGGGNMSANIAGDMDLSIGGGFNLKANSLNFDITNDSTIVSKTQHYTVSQSIDISAATINETSSGDINLNASGGGFLSSGGDLNFSAGGAGNFQSGGAMGLTGGSTATLAAGSVSLAGTITNQVIDPISGLIPIQTSGSAGSAAKASTAASGTPTGLPNAIAALQKNTGEAAPEEVPVPLPSPFLPDFDPETGLAYKHQQFLDTSANNALVAPDANTANVPTQNCTFDPGQHTFISDSSTWTIGTAGLSLIKSAEGFAKVVSTDKVTSYPDPATGAEPLTIGYGSTAVGIDQPVTLGELISRETAESYLEYSINKKFLPVLRQTISVPLTQNMIDACISLMYNIGPGNFTKSTLRKRINDQQWCDAADAFLVWNKAAGTVLSGLTSRRKKERTLFLS